jgi:hypothetical protein
MNATPGATNEYSRGSQAPRDDLGRGSGRFRGGIGHRSTGVGGGAGGLIVAGALLGALLLLVAEFTSLYQVHVATSLTPVQSVSGGSHNSYALVPIALLAAGLGIGVARAGSRPALLAVGVIGVVALLIALLVDLSDAQATGLALSPTHHYIKASSTPSAGLYMETLGSVILIATCGLGFMMLGPPPRPGRRPRAPEAEPGREG